MKFKYVFPAFFLSFSTLFAIENVKIENVIIYQSDAILEGKISKNISNLEVLYLISHIDTGIWIF